MYVRRSAIEWCSDEGPDREMAQDRGRWIEIPHRELVIVVAGMCGRDGVGWEEGSEEEGVCCLFVSISVVLLYCKDQFNVGSTWDPLKITGTPNFGTNSVLHKVRDEEGRK
jgi:hypothetical protein